MVPPWWGPGGIKGQGRQTNQEIKGETEAEWGAAAAPAGVLSLPLLRPTGHSWVGQPQWGKWQCARPDQMIDSAQQLAGW